MQWKSLRAEQEPGKTMIAIDWASNVEQDFDRESIKAFTEEALRNGMHYLRATVGNDYPFAPNLLVTMTKRPGHAADGAVIRISTDSMRRAMESDGFLRDQNQSLIVHELVHGLVVEEPLPVTIELAYMIEKGHREERLRSLKKIHTEGRLPQKYFLGLQQIAQFLDLDSVDQLFELHPDGTVATRLKAAFATAIRKEF